MRLRRVERQKEKGKPIWDERVGKDFMDRVGYKKLGRMIRKTTCPLESPEIPMHYMQKNISSTVCIVENKF